MYRFFLFSDHVAIIRAVLQRGSRYSQSTLSHQAPGAVAGANSPPLKLDLS